MDSRFYSCRKCGVIVGLVEGSLAGVTCDGEPLEMMRANSVDASREKHVPVVNVAESIIGSAEHPMTAAHHIGWIYLQTQKGGQRRALTIDDKPEAKFALVDGDKPVAVFAYCNLHGLWVTEL